MASANASPALIWNLTKKWNASLRTHIGTTFSTEQGNLRNIHSRVFSGYANPATLAISAPAAPKKGQFGHIQIATKRRVHNAPARQYAAVVAKNKTIRHNAQAVAHMLEFTAPHLIEAAQARVSQLALTHRRRAIRIHKAQVQAAKAKARKARVAARQA
ncbi:hypothetical protein CXG81DRAFT_25290 [Caulochytrium protostelioides]|uniref:Ribosomal eL28/Mak16 domain-containing protein n=1 Tax=Caulochytrium protostelioides TaxID=1555241 RepID=A0A4P9XAF1_9FUNG|nr:hypothetical protein CXG81DRAFT_25290 [Caulochytrium protostelioides]|eukprot:RKP02061.1 hypothetical protein CXG81DRAFT_25290 [Caulochytrium protostelioides]